MDRKYLYLTCHKIHSQVLFIQHGERLPPHRQQEFTRFNHCVWMIFVWGGGVNKRLKERREARGRTGNGEWYEGHAAGVGVAGWHRLCGWGFCRSVLHRSVGRDRNWHRRRGHGVVISSKLRADVAPCHWLDRHHTRPNCNSLKTSNVANRRRRQGTSASTVSRPTRMWLIFRKEIEEGWPFLSTAKTLKPSETQ